MFKFLLYTVIINVKRACLFVQCVIQEMRNKICSKERRSLIKSLFTAKRVRFV